jgi:DNA-binding transcriptional MerR regulator
MLFITNLFITFALYLKKMKIKYQKGKGVEKEIDINTFNLITPVDRNIGNDTPESLFELDFKLVHHRIYFIGAVNEMTSKNLMDWKKNGLLPSIKEPADQKWSRFNFLEVIWILTIIELKKFGMPNAQIKKVKDELIFSDTKYSRALEEFSIQRLRKDESFDKLSDEELLDFQETLAYQKALSNFNNVITEILVSRINSRIIVFSNWESYYYRGSNDFLEKKLFEEDFCEENNPTCTIERMEKESHVSISLTNLIINHLLIDNQNFNQSAKLMLTDTEYDLLQELKKDNVSEVKVKLKNKKIELIEVTENLKLSAEARIYELILTDGYQNFQFKTHKGNVISFERTTKYKI